MDGPDKASAIFPPDELRRVLTDLGIDIDHARVAVAVSGGADSLALALMAAEIMPIVTLTVDHGLRSDSKEEAQYVHDVMRSKNIVHYILTWVGEKPTSNIQSEARTARYKLMEDWCASEGIKYLLTAHHMADQAETFMLRLARGSGVYGLSAINPISKGITNHDIIIARPFINIRKEILEAYLESIDVEWIEDPSNLNDRYDRVKVREFFKAPVLDGLTVERVAQTAGHMKRVREALEHYQKLWLEKHVVFDEFGTASFEVSSLEDAPEEIILRSLAGIIRQVSGNAYVPRFEKLSRLYEALKTGIEDKVDGLTAIGHKGSTLLGTCIFPNADRITICRETVHIQDEYIVSDSDSVIWDGRFKLGFSPNAASPCSFKEKLIIKPLRKEGWSEILQKCPAFRNDKVVAQIPYQVKLSLPAIFDASGLRAVPHLGYNDLETMSITASLLSGVLSKK